MKNKNTRYNPKNEVVKYNFLEELEHSKDGKDPKTVNQYANALHEFGLANNFKDFKNYNSEWAIAFKNYLNAKRNKQTGEHISKSHYFNYISYVRHFFKWLIVNEKAYSKIKLKDINYLHTTRNDKNKARATGYQESHDVADILETIRKMPTKTELEMRNKAMLSLFLLTTPRISSIQKARLGNIRYFKDYEAWAFLQDPRLTNTKYSKTITAFFIGQSEDIAQNVLSWCDYLKERGFKNKDSLFPRISPCFTAEGEATRILSKEFIQSDSTIREVVKEAFKQNNLPYIKPHSFRHSIARRAKKVPNATEILIALAENDGHKSGMATIINSYAGDYLAMQSQLMKSLALE